jgi:hypothetical protein
LGLHLRWGWCLSLSNCRKRQHRAQSNHHYLSLKFFHAFCRSPHSSQSVFLFPPVAVLLTEGHIGKRVCPLTTLRHIANLQASNALRQGSTLLPCTPSRLYLFLLPRSGMLPPKQDNSCTFPGHLLTVEMHRNPAWDGRPNDSTSHKKAAIDSRKLALFNSFRKSNARATRP